MKKPRFWAYTTWRTWGLGFSITINEKGNWHDRAHGGIQIGPFHACFAIKDKSNGRTPEA
jgi:hypothetical protein